MGTNSETFCNSGKKEMYFKISVIILVRPTQCVGTLTESCTEAGIEGVNITLHMYTQEWGDFRIHFCAILDNADNKDESFDSDHIPYLFSTRQETFKKIL
jgi:hypothetical protein